MKFLSLILILLLSVSAYAVGAKYPDMPEENGWVEGHSGEPIILNWIKSAKHNDFDKFAHVMVQSYPREKKLEDYIKEGPVDENKCRTVKGGDAGEWIQIWCLKETFVNVLVYKGSQEEIDAVKPMILKWMIDD